MANWKISLFSNWQPDLKDTVTTFNSGRLAEKLKADLLQRSEKKLSREFVPLKHQAIVVRILTLFTTFDALLSGCAAPFHPYSGHN